MTDSPDADDVDTDLEGAGPPTPSEAPEAAPGPDAGPPPGDGAQEAPGAEDVVPDDLVCPICSAEGKPFTASSVRGYRTHRTRAHGPSAPERAGAEGTTEETVPTEPPKPPRRSMRDWLAAKRAGEKPAKAKKVREWGKGPREPLDEPIAWVYGGLGQMVVRGGTKFTPVGRVMQMQSPAVGAIGDTALKGSIVDKIAQPLLREGRQYKELAETIALPMATAMVIANPDWLGLTVDEQGRIFATGWLWEPYYALWETCAVQMAQGYERVEVKKRETATELAKIPWLQPIIAQGQDPIVYMIVDTLGLIPKPAGAGSAEPPVDVSPPPATPAAAVP